MVDGANQLVAEGRHLVAQVRVLWRHGVSPGEVGRDVLAAWIWYGVQVPEIGLRSHVWETWSHRHSCHGVFGGLGGCCAAWLTSVLGVGREKGRRMNAQTGAVINSR